MIPPKQAEPLPTPDDRAARGWLALAWLLAGAALARYLVILFGESAYGIAKYYMADDAFYYFQTARNCARGLGSTFDGVHATNGYHPLWFAIATAVFAVVPGDTAPLMALYALQVGLLVGAAALLFAALREHGRIAAAFTVALLLASWHGRKILFAGMESSVGFALGSALVLMAARRRERFFAPASAREAAGVCALLLALALARLEASLLGAGWVCAALVMDARAGGYARRRIVAVAATLALAGAAYVATNLAVVGVPVPISGLVKSGGTHTWDKTLGIVLGHRDAFIGLVAPPGGSRPAQWIAAVETWALLAALVALLVWARRRRMPGLVLVVLFALAFVSVSALVTGGIWAWYRWPALLAGVLATFTLLRLALEHVRPRGLALAALALATAVAVVPDWYLTLREHPLADWSPLRGFVMDRTVQFVREEIPAGDRLGGVSNGIVAYFSGRQMENLEGLANGKAFYLARRDSAGYAAYLREQRIRWIVLHAWSPDDRAWRFRTYVPAAAVDSVFDLDRFYGLDLAHTAFAGGRQYGGALSEPNVYFVRLKD
ncbi:MAG: hypothetical protein U0704_10250 [Candidatus Eisenbacteria bacterium]